MCAVADSDLVCQSGTRWEDINSTLKEKNIPLFFPVCISSHLPTKPIDEQVIYCSSIPGPVLYETYDFSPVLFLSNFGVQTIGGMVGTGCSGSQFVIAELLQ